MQAEIGQNIYFSYDSDYSYIELQLDDAPQDEPFTGWSLMPHMKPCRVSILYGAMITCLYIDSYVTVTSVILVKMIILFLHLV